MTEQERLAMLLNECGVPLEDTQVIAAEILNKGVFFLPEGLTRKDIEHAVNKQKPQKVRKYREMYKGVCPNCFQIEDSSANYCRACGQALTFPVGE